MVAGNLRFGLTGVIASSWTAAGSSSQVGVKEFLSQLLAHSLLLCHFLWNDVASDFVFDFLEVNLIFELLEGIEVFFHLRYNFFALLFQFHINRLRRSN